VSRRTSIDTYNIVVVCVVIKFLWITQFAECRSSLQRREGATTDRWARRLLRPAASLISNDSYHIDPYLSIINCYYSKHSTNPAIAQLATSGESRSWRSASCYSAQRAAIGSGEARRVSVSRQAPRVFTARPILSETHVAKPPFATQVTMFRYQAATVSLPGEAPLITTGVDPIRWTPFQ
jgi:hypothetical protein